MKSFWTNYFISCFFCCGCSVTSQVHPFATPWAGALQASLSLTISWSLPKFMSSVLFMAPFKSYCFWKCFLIIPSLNNYFPLVLLWHFIYISIITWSIFLSFYFLFTLFFLTYKLRVFHIYYFILLLPKVLLWC